MNRSAPLRGFLDGNMELTKAEAFALAAGYLSSDAKSFVRALLEKDPAKRLGSGAQGSAAVQAHPFFRGINWDLLYSRKARGAARDRAWLSVALLAESGCCAGAALLFGHGHGPLTVARAASCIMVERNLIKGQNAAACAMFIHLGGQRCPVNPSRARCGLSCNPRGASDLVGILSLSQPLCLTPCETATF